MTAHDKRIECPFLLSDEKRGEGERFIAIVKLIFFVVTL